MEFFKDPSFWFSIITAGTAIIALFQTRSQIRVSNKQNLFEKRMNILIKVTGLMKLYEENRNLMIEDNKKDDSVVLMVDFNFENLTNNTYLEDIAICVHKALEQPYQKQLLTRLEELRNISTTIMYLFPDKQAKVLSEFVYNYQETLFTIYQYQILSNNIRKDSIKFKTDAHDMAKQLSEPKHREKLLLSYKKLEESYKKIITEDIIEEIRKKIKLK